MLQLWANAWRIDSTVSHQMPQVRDYERSTDAKTIKLASLSGPFFLGYAGAEGSVFLLP